MRDTTLYPLLALIAADAMEQIQDGIFFVFGITRRRINLHPTFYTDCLGVVLNPLKFAMFNSFALFVETLRWIWKGWFVVRLYLDRPAKSPASAWSALARGRLR